MNCVCSKQNQWANMRKSPNIGKNRAILMPSLLKTAKSADSWRPSAERRKIQTLDQCFPNGDRNHQTKLLARSKRSLANFLIAGGMSILWNVLAAALIYFWFPFY